MKDHFNIVHAIDSLCIGGAQAMLFELYKAIERYHPDVSQAIMLLNERKADQNFIGSYGLKYYPTSQAQLSRQLRDYKEPVVLVYHKLLASNCTLYRAMVSRIPVITVNHTYTESASYNRIEPCDALVCVSDNMARVMKDFVGRQKTQVIHNGVNVNRYDPILSGERIDGDQDCLVTGRINNLNNIKYSDKWVDWVLGVNLPFKMVHEYMGSGIHGKRASKLIRKKQDARNEVRMLGGISDFEDKVKRIKTWDLFLYEINQPEGVSIAILESLACGVPVICSNHYGNKEIIQDGVNGYVFNSKPEAKEILTELGLNRNVLADLKRSTIEHFKKHLDAKIMADKYVDLCKDVLSHDRSLEVKLLAKELPRKKYSKSQKSIAKDLKPIRKKARIGKPKNSKSKKDKKRLPDPDVVMTTKISKSGNTMADKPKFTILTSAYNASPFVKDWAKSILQQKYRPLEVVYVDDASKDGLIHEMAQVYNDFKEAGIEMKVIQNKDRLYCGSSYEIARSNATGSFFGVLDSDDALVDDAVVFIMDFYLEHSKITWAYTQFQTCDSKLRPKKTGISRPPHPGETLLSMGERRKHAFSHWRTYSHRFPKPNKIFKKGLKCSVDKYMGYRLEEFGRGAFVDRICYKYREKSSPKNISSTEPTRDVWKAVTKEARKRRKVYDLKAHPIKVFKYD